MRRKPNVTEIEALESCIRQAKATAEPDESPEDLEERVEKLERKLRIAREDAERATEVAMNIVLDQIDERLMTNVTPEELDAYARVSGRHMPLQKPGKSKQDYGTPKSLIRAVERRFGPLVCDLAAHHTNAKAPAFYTKEQNTLVQAWAKDYPDGNLWLNPEFADIEPYAEKCWVESRQRHGLIHLLVPASIGANWFAKFVAGKSYVEGLSPRITFEGCDQPYPKDVMLCTYGYGLSGFSTWRWEGTTK